MEDIHQEHIAACENNTSILKLEPGIVHLEPILEEHMEQLELDDSDMKDVIVNLESQKISKHLSPAPSNRRYSLRPQKRLQNTEYAMTQLKKKRLCLSKSRNLETIFENPVIKNGSIVLLGRALKRSIAFNESLTKAKVKRRKSKIKRLSVATKRKTIKKITLDDVKSKLQCLEEFGDGEWLDVIDSTP